MELSPVNDVAALVLSFTSEKNGTFARPANEQASGNPWCGRFLSAAPINSAGLTLLIGSCGFNHVDDIYPGVGQMEKQTFPSFAPPETTRNRV